MKSSDSADFRRTKDAVLYFDESKVDASVLAKVGNYGYEARMSKGNNPTPWTGEIVQPITKPFEDYLDLRIYRWLDFPIGPLGFRMFDLIGRKGVTLDSIEYVDKAAKPQQVRLTFTCAEGHRKLPGVAKAVESGTITMTPSRLWTIDKAVGQTPDREISMSLKYGKPENGKIIVLHSRFHFNPKKGEDIVVNYIYDIYSHTPLDASAFSPTPYGLEPPNEEDK